MSEYHQEGRMPWNRGGNERGSFISGGSQVGTPQQSRIQVNNTQFVPKIIESGYIVGPPIAYTQQPNLPPNFNPFTPRGSSIMAESSINYPRDHSRSRSNTPTKIIINSPTSPPPIHFTSSEVKQNYPYQPQISVHAPPPSSSIIREQTVAKSTYDHCVSECKNWQTKYNELYLKYMNQMSQNGREEVEGLKDENYRLRVKVRDLEGRDKNNEITSVNVKDLIERYKESTLKEMYLLHDRYRLECKHNSR